MIKICQAFHYLEICIFTCYVLLVRRILNFIYTYFVYEQVFFTLQQQQQKRNIFNSADIKRQVIGEAWKLFFFFGIPLDLLFSYIWILNFVLVFNIEFLNNEPAMGLRVFKESIRILPTRLFTCTDELKGFLYWLGKDYSKKDFKTRLSTERIIFCRNFSAACESSLRPCTLRRKQNLYQGC